MKERPSTALALPPAADAMANRNNVETEDHSASTHLIPQAMSLHLHTTSGTVQASSYEDNIVPDHSEVNYSTPRGQRELP